MRLLIALFSIFLSLCLQANLPLSVPDTLAPWKGWVLKGYETRFCPVPYNNPSQNTDNYLCTWPANVTLTVLSQEARFTQKAALYSEGWLPLPGDELNWPQEVKVNGQAFPVMAHQGLPALFLLPGEYMIEGKLTWESLPDSLHIPPRTGTLTLSLEGKLVDQPDRDPDGKIWIRRNLVHSTKEQDTLSIKVFRLLQDQIPLIDHTRLRLAVGGQIREMSVGPVLQPHTLPLKVTSPLPAKLEENGMLRLQIKPGSWDIDIESRYLGDQLSFTLMQRLSPWPKEEIWSFQPQNNLRLVEIEGGVSLDPQQTDMPVEWQQFPAYLMQPNSTLALVEKRRGEDKARASQIDVTRKMWLDFSGKGYTLQDTLTGTIEQQWRLHQMPPLQLGRVTIENKDKLITQLAPNDPPGVEIRQGKLDLTSVSRIKGRPFRLPAVGWDIDHVRLSTLLFLPPGWKLLDAWGVDTAPQAWIQTWTLLDFFLVLVIAAATLKLLGMRWGVLALITLILIYKEKGAPVYGWLNLLAVLALLRVVQGKVQKGLSVYFQVSFAIVVLICLPFMAKQIREALYPQLTVPNAVSFPEAATLKAMSANAAAPAPMMMNARVMMSGVGGMDSAASPVLEDYDPSAKIQTGPGVPRWQWNAYELTWNGPVLKSQTLKLWLLPSFVNSMLKLLQVILIGWFLYGLIKSFRHRQAIAMGIACLVGVIFFQIPSTAQAADFPPPALLKELRERLLEPPSCLPECAGIDRMQINVADNQLTIRLTAQVAMKTALPLPATLGRWMPRTVQVSQNKDAYLQLDPNQRLWIQLEAGVHEILLEGPIGDQDKFEITVPLSPQFVSVQSNAWLVEGIFRHRLQGESIYFSRLKLPPSKEGEASAFQAGRIPSFVEWTRHINLGMEWEILNEIKRVAPSQGGINLILPLLPEESVLSDKVEVKGGKAYLSLDPDQAVLKWRSKLKIMPTLTLTAIADPNVKESWQLDAITQWHCEFSGIPLVHQNNASDAWQPTWQPWPGEKVRIEITRPLAMPGRTMTIEESRLSSTPGERVSDHLLALTIRSTQGSFYTLHIPKDVILQGVLVNEISQPMNMKEGEVTVPINPGNQTVTLKWQSPQGNALFYRTPKVNLQSPSTNDFIDLQLSKDRWILFLGGPAIGPAVLFWGALLVIVAAAVFLGQSKLTPLKSSTWGLLGVGLTLATPLALIFVVVWFIAMQMRKKKSASWGLRYFQFVQVSLVLLTLAFVVSLFSSISSGLVGEPHMQLSSPSLDIARSYFTAPAKYYLQWYQDSESDQFPQAWVFSVPLYVYRTVMLLWALWLALSLVKWLRWGWDCFSTQGYWRK